MTDKDQYITNITGEEDDDIVNKLKSLQEELENANNELQQKNKTILDQKHSIDDLTIEIKTLTEKNQSQLNLIKFYEENEDKNQNASPEDIDNKNKEKIKELEIKIMNLNDKISDLEAELIKKDNQLEVAREELDEQVNLGDKLLNLMNEKEEELKALKENQNTPVERKKTVDASNDKELTPEEVQELKEIFMNQQEEFDEYKASTEKKLKSYSEENMNLTKQVTELKQKISELEDETSKLRDIKEEFEMEKQMGEEENKKFEENQDNKIQGYLSEINNLRTQLEESRQQLEDNKANNKESAKIERQEYEKIIENLKEEKEKLEEKLSKFENDQKEKPQNDNTNVEEVNSIERAKKEEENNKIIENLSTSVHNLDKQVKEKIAKIDILNTQIEQISKENEELKQTISGFDKIKKELEDKEKRDEKEKNSYVKKIKDLTDKLKANEDEIADLKKKAESNNTCTLGDMLDDDPNTGLQDQLDEANNTIEKLKEEIKYYERQITDLTNRAKKSTEFEAKNIYLNETVETLKKNIEEINNAKKRAEDDFHSQIDSLEIELAKKKTELATIIYDNDKTMVKYKNYVKKLEGKLIGLGFKFKNKTKRESKSE